MRLLLVEKDYLLADLLCRCLMQAGHQVVVAYNWPDASYQAENGSFDLYILDLLQCGDVDVDGARRLQALHDEVPLLVFSAHKIPRGHLHGLDVGAAGSVVQPFGFEEVLDHLRSIAWRNGLAEPEDDDRLFVGDLILDFQTHEVTRAGKPLVLTPKEFALLAYLMRHPGQVLTRNQILERVWDYAAEVSSNVVDSTIRRLRKEVDADSGISLIFTVRGVGYKIMTA